MLLLSCGKEATETLDTRKARPHQPNLAFCTALEVRPRSGDQTTLRGIDGQALMDIKKGSLLNRIGQTRFPSFGEYEVEVFHAGTITKAYIPEQDAHDLCPHHHTIEDDWFTTIPTSLIDPDTQTPICQLGRQIKLNLTDEPTPQESSLAHPLSLVSFSNPQFCNTDSAMINADAIRKEYFYRWTD